MKKNYIIVTAILLFATLNTFAQTTNQVEQIVQKDKTYLGEHLKIKPKTIEDLKQTTLIYQYEMDMLAIDLNEDCNDEEKKCSDNKVKVAQFKTAIEDLKVDLDLINKLRNNLDKKIFYNNKLLNILFADEVGSYVNGGSDLSVNKYFAGLDLEDKSVSFSMNFTGKGKTKLDPLRWVYSAGFKASTDEKFATIYKKGKFENDDLAITGKITFIGNGKINIKNGASQKQIKELVKNNKNFAGQIAPIFDKEKIILNYRELLLKKYSKKIEEYTSTDYPKEVDSLKAIYDSVYNNVEKLSNKTEELIESKYDDFYEKIAQEEINFLKKNKLFCSLKDYWLSFDFIAPIGQKKYNFSLTSADPTIKSINFYPFKCNMTAAGLIKFSNQQTLFGTLQLSAFNNNNIIADDITAITFQTISVQSPTQQAILKSDDDVYVVGTGFDNFVTGNIKAEVSYFFLTWLGISPAIEKNFGQYYHPLNWKIGLPLSLKDKEGKPSVNIEAQYKKVNKIDIVGLNVSFLLGNFLN
jgi:hypothetical protein